jgi:hypothetical protein
MACDSSTVKVTICVPWFSCRRSFRTVYRKNTVIYDRIWERYDRLRFPYFAVFRHTRSRTYTIVIRSYVVWRNMVVYDTVYGVRNRRPGHLKIFEFVMDIVNRIVTWRFSIAIQSLWFIQHTQWSIKTNLPEYGKLFKWNSRRDKNDQ